MRRAIMAGLTVLIVAVGGWYFYSPIWTVNQMRAAADAGDTGRLAEFVDFAELRISAREKIKAKLAAAYKANGHSGPAPLENSIALQMINGWVSEVAAPIQIRAIFMADKTWVGRNPARFDAASDRAVVARMSPNRFWLQDQDRPDLGVGFTRDGIGWKLTEIQIPK